MQDYAVWALSLAISADDQKTVADCGGVEPLIAQLSDSRFVNQQQAAAAIAKLGLDNPDTRQAIQKVGGPP